VSARTRRLSFVIGLAVLVAAGPAHALKVMSWNIHAYDTATNTVSWRQASFRTVIAAADPDVIIVQELFTSAAQDSFYFNVLGVVQPGQWTKGSYQTGIKTPQSAVFWKTARVNVTTIGQLDDGGPRNVLFGVVKPLGYVSNPGWFRVYSMHLKAGGPATADSSTRRGECTNLRATLNVTTGQGPNFMLGGDTNFYSAFEGGYIRLTESQGGANDWGRSFDWLGTVMGSSDWHVNPAFASYDTQSPCNACPSDFSGGGMDDRFDIFFTSTSLHDTQGVDITSYYAYGNDGYHFNTDINEAPTNAAVGQTIADALWGASDHLPVMTVVQLASRVVAASQVNFGSVIVGGLAQQTLNVGDGGVAPVDALDYSFSTVPAGFTAPAGAFNVANGASPNAHTLGMSSAGAGTLTGTLVMTTDDPDSLVKNVKLAGTVLDHAQPSLDSLLALAAVTLDWGDRPQGSFGDSAVTAFDRGYGPLRARLNISGATITGGSGRFSLVGASFPVLVAASGARFTVRFDDTNAATDTTYEATLVFATADETLPGGTSLAPLTVTLRAHRTSDTGADDGAPRRVAFLAPRPNPLSSGCQLGFELPRAAEADLAIYDLTGRRIATLASGTQGAGRHLLRWDAVDANGARVGAGVYFTRFRTAGMDRTARVVVLP
jgi:endonuclease/exonuclease/phosphatase family metal-dependent hydrolase